MKTSADNTTGAGTEPEPQPQSSSTCPCEQPAVLPNMECVDRVKKLPLVEAAWNQSAALYNNVKEYNSVFAWTLETAEATVNKAVEQTLPVVAPIVKRLETPIGMVDKTLCKGLDVVENAVPCIKQEPAQIAENTKNLCDPAYQQVKSLQELSWRTANEMLKTDVGHLIVGGIDNISATTDRILDFVLPSGQPLGIPRREKVIQALVTIGGLPNLAARKAYETMANILHAAGQQDLRQNLRSILTLIQLQNLVSSSCPEDSTESSVTSPSTSVSSQNVNTVPQPAAPVS